MPSGEPSAVPSAEPSGLPSSAPTSPSSEPSGVPSGEPTSQPSGAPSAFLQSAFPITNRTEECYLTCTYPGMTVDVPQWTTQEYCAFYASTGCTNSTVRDYSCSPQCLSTCSDVFCDTFASFTYCGQPYDEAGKTSIENSCQSSVAASSPTSTNMNMSSTIGLENVDSTSVNSDSSAQNSLILTLSDVVSGLSASGVTIENVTTLTNRRLGTDRRALAAIGASVTYRISVVLEEFGYSSTQSQDLFDSLSNQIVDAVNFGVFKDTLLENSNDAGTVVFDSVVVQQNPVQTIESVVAEVTVAPTPAPSTADIVSSDGDSGLGTGAIVAISICVPLFVLAVGGFAYYWFYLRNADPDNSGADKSAVVTQLDNL